MHFQKEENIRLDEDITLLTLSLSISNEAASDSDMDVARNANQMSNQGGPICIVHHHQVERHTLLLLHHLLPLSTEEKEVMDFKKEEESHTQEDISTLLTLSNDGVVKCRRDMSRRQIINNEAVNDDDDPLRLSLNLIPTRIESYERYEAKMKRRRRRSTFLIHSWTIIKQLFKSDINESSRLLIKIKEVERHILPFLNEIEKDCLFSDSEGVRMKVYDVQTKEEYGLNLKRWTTGSYVLTSNWSKDFVRRRELLEKDTIGLYFDAGNRRLCFGVVSKAPVVVVVVTPAAVADPSRNKRRRGN